MGEASGAVFILVRFGCIKTTRLITEIQPGNALNFFLELNKLQKDPADAKPGNERQGQRAAGFDGKLLTEC